MASQKPTGGTSMALTPAPLELLPEAGFWIGDRRVTDASGGTFQHVYAATGVATSEVPLAGAEEMDAAVRAARAALPGWRTTPADRRRTLLNAMAGLITERAERLAMLNVIDNGTPLMIAGVQSSMAADLFSYNAGWADKGGGEVHDTWPVPALDYSIEEPFGVVGVIIPWNGPMAAIGQVVAPALAAGNCVVIKPPELAPYTALMMGELFLEAGFPPGVVSVIPGGPTGGEALVGHPGIDKVHFTGSGNTAKQIVATATRTLKPVGLELGGKSAILVFEDADVPMAAAAAANAISINLSGQGCITGTRVIAHRSVYDELVQEILDLVSDVAVGDPFDISTVMGPVVNETACSRILGVIDNAQASQQGRLVVGGTRLGAELAEGYFIAPAVFADVDPLSALAQQEIFGPVQTVIPFESEGEAIALANNTDYGLAAYVHTQNLSRAHRVAAALESGMVWVNGGFGIPSSVPFGGVKQSGWGRIGGRHGIREFTRPKNVWIAL